MWLDALRKIDLLGTVLLAPLRLRRLLLLIFIIWLPTVSRNMSRLLCVFMRQPLLFHFLLLFRFLLLLVFICLFVRIFLRCNNFFVLDELGIFVQRRAEVDQVAQHLLPHQAQTTASRLSSPGRNMVKCNRAGKRARGARVGFDGAG
jgi:hypothetical protein